MSSSQTRFVLGLILGLMLQPVAAHSQSQRESQHATALADLLREQAARVDRLNIPAQICKAAIIDDGAVAGSFCQFAALLLKDSQFEVLPFIQGQ